MSEERIEPIDPELGALLDAERRATAPADALGRVWTRVAGGGPPGAGGRTPGGWLASHAAGVAVAAFFAGGLVGAGVHAALQKPPVERVVYVERPAPSGSRAVAPSSAPSPAPVTRDESAAPLPLPAPASSVRGVASSSLSAERAVLDSARAALATGDSAKSLSLLEDHQRRFPRGQLGEEREALAIQALVTLGRYDEARARAARFRAAVPNSLFSPAVEASLSSIP